MLKLAAATLLAVAAVVVLAARFYVYNPRADETVRPEAKPAEASKVDSATFTVAARMVANRFIETAVARKDPAAWRLLDPTFPCLRRSAKKAWQSGQVRFVPVGPFRTKDVSFSVSERLPKRVWLDVVIQRMPRQPVVYQMGLRRHGHDHWLVDWWDIPWGPPSAWCE